MYQQDYVNGVPYNSMYDMKASGKNSTKKNAPREFKHTNRSR